jgi:protein-tyrosine-phosphatase
MSRVYNTLFLCTGNSARSIMAECILRRWGQNRFHAFSAGSHPRGAIHPLTVDLLQQFHHPVDGLRSKSWEEFATPDSPPLDFVFTVCDQAAGEICPAWPGQPMTAHWGVEDPTACEGTREVQLKMFRRVYLALDARIKIFSSLRVDGLDRLSLQRQLDQIGQVRPGEVELPPFAVPTEARS